jgi:hypothetical protein
VLIGIAEAQNSRQGLRSQAPVLIGNADMAKLVMSGGTGRPLLSFTALRPDEAAVLRLESQKSDNDKGVRH